jgi:hypothetical protein
MESIRITLTVWVATRLGRLSQQGTREADDRCRGIIQYINSQKYGTTKANQAAYLT